jgi:hypothetical protein
MATKSSWAAELASSISEKADKVPDGWVTTEQIAKQISRDITTARRVAREALASDRAQVKLFRVRMPSGNVLPVKHYKITT